MNELVKSEITMQIGQSAQNLRNELKDMAVAAKALQLKTLDVESAYDVAVRLFKLVTYNFPLDIDMVRRARDMAYLASTSMRLFAWENGLDADKHRAYADSVLSYLGELERELLK
jgi:hypothetical protein